MEKKKKETLMDFLRSEAELLDLMNMFLYLFREKDILYVCSGQMFTHIPSYFSGKYEITKIVPAKYRIHRPLFKEPELTVTQPPELWARCLEERTYSYSSVDNHRQTEKTTPDLGSANRISFQPGRATVILGKLSIFSEFKLYVFYSLAYTRDPERVEKYETPADFERRYCVPGERRDCIARISELPILCFP
jgi:hypothetical protein